MKINANVKIVGDKVVLVPYSHHHVEKYHTWMQDKELQQLTASEPLSLEEEYKMQQSWLNDEDKCTFIILDKVQFEKYNNEIDAMIGDTNVFLNTVDNSVIGESEIMIAEKSFRRGGKGKEAMMLMLRYCVENLKITQFEAKIGYENLPSIGMFQKMKFTEYSKSEVFKELTLRLNSSNEWISWLEQSTINSKVERF